MTNEPNKRVSKKQLAELKNSLTEKDFQILELLAKAKFANSDQLETIFFAKNKSKIASKRATNRTMRKLEDFGLISSLPRKIGGVNFSGKAGGSSSTIYQTTAAGMELLRLKFPDKMTSQRKRNFSPTINFLEHTLAITETFVKLKALENREKIEILETDFEPKSWRNFSGGFSEILKPDLFVKIVNGQYDESYFFEIDRATESGSRILTKCKTYISYFNSGIEQRINQLFPFVVWLVPSEKRRTQIENLLREKLPRSGTLFQVIEFSELQVLISGDKNKEND